MTLPNIDYTNRDYETIKAALITSIQAKFPSTYRDFTESSFGMMLLELIAFVFDNLSYQLDVYCNEMFLPTARDRESISLLAKLVGYDLRPATSASVVVKATLPEIQSYNVVIPAYTEVSSIHGVKFETLAEQVIPAGTRSKNLMFYQGTTITDEFESDGTPFQEFKLSTAPLILNSLKVIIDGFEWNKVDSLVYSSGVDQSWSLRTDVDDYGYVKFGDGVSGQIPTNGTRIICQYRVGGGIIGNIPIGDIEATVTGNLAGTYPLVTVDVSLRNEERGSGGEERETIDHARFFIPRWARTNSRAVTEADFDTLGSLFNDPYAGAPAYVKCALKQRVPELNTVMCWVWGRDSEGNITKPSQTLKNALSDYFNNNGPGAVRIITVDVEVADGDIVYIDMDVDVVPNGLLTDGETLYNVNNTLEEFFKSATNQPGTPVRMSRLYSAIQSTTGVEHSLIKRIVATYWKTEIIGTFDGNSLNYIYTSQHPIRPGTVTITVGQLIINDDGHGRLIGDVDPTAINIVDYGSSSIRFTLSRNVGIGEEIVLKYRYPLQYQRSEVGITTPDGYKKTFVGKLSFAPLVKNTVAITDGTQTVIDNGTGRLVGDVDTSKPAVVDYTSGSYQFTFPSAPGADLTISASYVQRLDITSGDIPIEKHQLAVKGVFNIGLIQK